MSLVLLPTSHRREGFFVACHVSPVTSLLAHIAATLQPERVSDVSLQEIKEREAR